MEGVSHESCSLAGTLGLNKLIVIYDMNNISIDGDISIAFTENIKKRFDLIYTEEVLEHLSDPIETLIKLSKLLKNDGFMIHKFPSSKFFQLKLNFNYVPKKDCAHPLEHINIFCKNCI